MAVILKTSSADTSFEGAGTLVRKVCLYAGDGIEAGRTQFLAGGASGGYAEGIGAFAHFVSALGKISTFPGVLAVTIFPEQRHATERDHIDEDLVCAVGKDWTAL